MFDCEVVETWIFKKNIYRDFRKCFTLECRGTICGNFIDLDMQHKNRTQKEKYFQASAL